MKPQNNLEFFAWLKKESENVWENAPLNENVYGFQIQAGTKWLPGLTHDEINHFEEEIGFSFPQIYREFLTCMNGTDKDAVNVYANSGLPYVYNSGYYSYPRDLEQVRGLIHWIYEAFSIDEAYVVTNNIPHILPLVGHRFLVIDNCGTNPVLSMYEQDVIVYAKDLKSFLLNDIFRSHAFDIDIPANLAVKYWLAE